MLLPLESIGSLPNELPPRKIRKIRKIYKIHKIHTI